MRFRDDAGRNAAPGRLARPSSPAAPVGAQPSLQESAPFYGADSYGPITPSSGLLAVA